MSTPQTAARSAVQPLNHPTAARTTQYRWPVLLIRVANKRVAQLGGQKTTQGNPVPTRQAQNICLVDGLVFEDCPSQVASIPQPGHECPRWIPIRAGSTMYTPRHQTPTGVSNALTQPAATTEGANE